MGAMFEEICLVCGKQLTDYGWVFTWLAVLYVDAFNRSAYCSGDCHGRDATSPSISSSSSALSSPNNPVYASGPDIPPLLLSFPFRSPDDDLLHPELPPDPKQLSSPNSALRYARRPSATNNHSTVPTIHQSMSSTSDSSSALLPPTPSNDDLSDPDDSDLFSEKGSDSALHPSPHTSKRTCGPASLPPCFSLLQMSSDPQSSPVSSSSGRTIARPSPPTPKLPESFQHLAIHTTPRGRRRARRQSSSDSSHSEQVERGRATLRGSSSRGRRGRARNDELQGIGFSSQAPGFGSGRSGLVGRDICKIK